uniref:Uncharacterized protein n=1 Tax=Zea mays TaxID=4577 RepID=A0A804LD25_MAIZE
MATTTTHAANSCTGEGEGFRGSLLSSLKVPLRQNSKKERQRVTLTRRRQTEQLNSAARRLQSSASSVAASALLVPSLLLPLVRVTREAALLGDVRDLDARVVDLAGAPPPRQHLAVGPHPLAVVPARHHHPELERARRRLPRAPRRPVVARHEPPVGRTHLHALLKRKQAPFLFQSNSFIQPRSFLRRHVRVVELIHRSAAFVRAPVPYLRDVYGDDVGLPALVEEPDGEVAGGRGRSVAPLLHPHRQVSVLVLARHPAVVSHRRPVGWAFPVAIHSNFLYTPYVMCFFWFTSCTRRRLRGVLRGVGPCRGAPWPRTRCC